MKNSQKEKIVVGFNCSNNAMRIQYLYDAVEEVCFEVVSSILREIEDNMKDLGLSYPIDVPKDYVFEVINDVKNKLVKKEKLRLTKVLRREKVH